MKLERILVPVDFTERSMKALRYAADLARRVGAEVEVLHVWEPPAYVAPEMMVGLAEEAGHRTLAELARTEIDKEMQRFLQELETLPDVQVRGQLEVGAIPHAILKRAEEGHHDLLVLATHGRTGLQRLVVGSVTEKIVRLAKCPVLTLHTGE